MYSFLEKNRQWLLPVFLIIFIMEMVTFPYAADLTYAGRSESPEHVLTYTTNKLTWDNATNINDNGVAELSLFDVVYDNAKSSDGRNIVAPGLEGSNLVRLKNEGTGKVTYTAVLYRICSNENLPVQITFSTENAKDSDNYKLPNGVAGENVIQAVTGTLNKGTIHDFDIRWAWEYYTSDQQDEIDTALGNKDKADDIVIGLYIVVEDENATTIYPAKTGDSSHTTMYFALLCISGLVLVLLLREREGEFEECPEAVITAMLSAENIDYAEVNEENKSSSL